MDARLAGMTALPARALPALDPAFCPLCGQSNQCAMEIERATGVKQPPCWCTQVDFNRGALDKLPAEARGQACICSACARPVAPVATGS